MADQDGNQPGDAGYDPTTDQNNQAVQSGDNTVYLDSNNNYLGTVDSGGNWVDGGQTTTTTTSTPPVTQDTSQTQGGDQFQYQQTTNPWAGQPGQNSTAALNAIGLLDNARTRALQAQGLLPQTLDQAANWKWPATQPGQPQQPGQPRQPGGGGGGSVGDPQAIMAAKQAADEQLAKALAAVAAANEQDFNEKVREFNLDHERFMTEANAKLSAVTGVYNGTPTLAAQQQQADLSGMYNGQPTESARQFNVTTERDLADMASKLTGPADYFKFLSATNAGRDIIGSLQSGQARPSFGGETGQSFEPQSLQNIFQRLGIGQQGGAQTRFAQSGGIGGQGQSASSPQSGQPNTGMPSGQAAGGLQLPNNMGSIPLPHQINPAVWDSWGKTGQDFIRSAAASAGFDPTEFERQINAARPGTGTYGAPTQGAFSSGGESAF